MKAGDGTSWLVVTGAGGALGGALARTYAARGRNILAVDRDPARLEEFLGIERIATVAVDLTDPDAVESAFAVTKSAGIGALVNAAGLIWNEPALAFKSGALARHDIGAWSRTIAANLTAPFVACVCAAAVMARRGGGAIVNFSSVAAVGNPGQVAYSAAKAGLEGMTKSMAQELGPLGIRVNALALGFIDVPTTREAVQKEAIERHVGRTAMRRLGEIDDVVKATDTLLDSPFLTGIVLPVDGGLRL